MSSYLSDTSRPGKRVLSDAEREREMKRGRRKQANKMAWWFGYGRVYVPGYSIPEWCHRLWESVK